MAPTAAPTALHRRSTAPGVTGSVVLVPLEERRRPGRDDPPFDSPPRPPETGGGGGGGGDGFDEPAPTPRPALPFGVWLMAAAMALALPAGFLAAALVHRGV